MFRARNLTYPFQPRPSFLHAAFRSLCFAGCGNSCSFVIVRTSPHSVFGGCRPHTPPSRVFRALNPTARAPCRGSLCISVVGVCFSKGGGTVVPLFLGELSRTRFSGLLPHTPASCEIQALNLTYPFQPRPPFLHFAFRSLCFAGCGNFCSSVFGRTFPHPDPVDCRPHTPASCVFRALNLTYPFQPKPPFLHFAFRSLCFAGCGNSCSFVIVRTSPHPVFGAAAPYPRFL